MFALFVGKATKCRKSRLKDSWKGISAMENVPSVQSQNIAAFTPRADDVYIVTYPRSGTTWLQMIIYQLTTSGDMDFTHISQFIPFLERAFLRDRKLERLSSPRAFKTHWQLSRVMRWPGKYIYVTRNGRDVLVSYYYFYKEYHNFNQSFAEFMDRFLEGTVQYGTWFHHIADSRLHLNDNSVLFLSYEDLVASLEERLQDIITFLGLNISTADRTRVLDRCTFRYMREHESKFDHATEVLWEKTQELSRGTFLRQGKPGNWKEHLTPEQELAFECAVSRVRGYRKIR